MADPSTLTLRQLHLPGWLRILRPLNVVLFFVGVLLGGILAGGSAVLSGDSAVRLVLAMVSAALIGGAGNVVNDLYDVDIDRVNRPERPIPSGEVSLRTARTMWITLTLLGLLVALWVSLIHLCIAFVSAVLLWTYSAKLKRIPAVGNLTVALILGIAVLYGGLVPEDIEAVPVLVGALFAFLTTLAREIAKDLEDVEGDVMYDARTIPVVFGQKTAVRSVLALILATLFLLPLSAMFGFDPAFVGYALPAGFALLAAAWSILAIAHTVDHEVPAETVRAAASSSMWLKITMIAGVLALALSRL
ncbi:MAG: geranylgeranylglycerol-phosphate geranylgeranyltransferase [Rubricoccaceae bacterium]|nr:geranylgeranylglycerol-phosphate geranylgeranyltransferase [Rubricoccaceae bacterium]